MIRSWASRRASSAACVAVAWSGYPMAISVAMWHFPFCVVLSLTERGDEDRLDGVQPVFGLVEYDAGAGVEYLARYLQARGHAGVVHYFAPDNRVRVVVCGQAVHEFDHRVPALFHQLGVYLIRLEHPHAFRPDVFSFTHRYPHVGVDEVD